MHWVQALIAPRAVLIEASLTLPSAVICPLQHGLSLLPVTHAVEHELQTSAWAQQEPHPPLVEDIAAGLAPLAAQLSHRGPVLYAATFFHGGMGYQDALVWEEGQLTLKLSDTPHDMSNWPDTPISLALRHLGIVAKPGLDEFDSVGLGLHRSNEAWADEYSKH
ncbi:hypothetical protein [Leeia aquatica]|uniref:Uncharacterized protein n=1 Tax=Leeia aquatica TaxID=2725557 RepID=A0A847RYH3_9NEIS|nr:hypothetical protein [Leeia aquatica]NLR76200.1 hypothetical protein [Leeia aquatica]